MKKKKRIKSKSFRIKRHHPFFLNPHNTKRTNETFPESFSIFHFRLSFVCFIYYREMFLSLFTIVSFLLLASTFLPPRLIVFVSFLFCPHLHRFAKLYTRLISSNKHSHKYISILKLDTQKSFHFSLCWSSLLLLLLLCYEVFKFYFNVCTEH